MATVTGFVEKIKYHNDDNGYTVLSISGEDDGEEYILVGTFSDIEAGEYITASGQMSMHPLYGDQLQVESYELKQPEDTKSVERYLSSGAVKGVGEKLAARIVKYFKDDTLRIMEEEPERLGEVKGISTRMAMDISEQVQEKKQQREAMMFLSGYGISMNLSVKIYNEYGSDLYTVIKENPYKIADDIAGVGFKIADDIASKAGIAVDSHYRMKSACLYVLSQAAGQGHMYLPENELCDRCREILGTDIETISLCLSDMQIEKRIVVKASEKGQIIYPSTFYYKECSVAAMLHDLDIRTDIKKDEIEKKLSAIEKAEGLKLDEQQRQAVFEAVRSGLLIITGGPGTGKTTTINSIIQFFEGEGAEIMLAAPTGRAAKRITEATGHEAKTIHRLLEVTGMPQQDDSQTGMKKVQYSSMHFERNEQMPLEADVVIIDEVSMVDIHLISSLLKAVAVGTRLILVGDINQLPSVGPGNVLKDMIDSEVFNVVRLEKIYRQASESDITVNAHRMIAGEKIDLTKRSRDFLFIKRPDPDSIIAAMLTLVREKLPQYVHAKIYDVQVMTPMRKGALGVERLNQILQENLNPHDKSKAEKEFSGVVFREGDKVMQIKNNYQAVWEIKDSFGDQLEKGTGIYNGDMGVIKKINEFAELLTVEFDEGKTAEYAFSDALQLELAYAITIHKSQGNEYPAVVIPVWQGPRILLTRNLIYTAVTRARTCVALVGSPECFNDMVSNTQELKRYSGLMDRIREICKV